MPVRDNGGTAYVQVNTGLSANSGTGEFFQVLCFATPEPHAELPTLFFLLEPKPQNSFRGDFNFNF
jgi:hypothetical protein